MPRSVAIRSPQSIPPNVQHITILCYEPQDYYLLINALPSSASSLEVRYFKFGSTDAFNVALPSFITHFRPSNHFNTSTIYLPPKVTNLKLGSKFNQPVDNLPSTLTHLTFGDDFNMPVDHLPPNIIHLKFGFEFNQPVNNLPPSLTHLTFNFNFNQSLDHLPSTLIHLVSSSSRQPPKVITSSHSWEQLRPPN